MYYLGDNRIKVRIITKFEIEPQIGLKSGALGIWSFQKEIGFNGTIFKKILHYHYSDSAWILIGKSEISFFHFSRQS